jgi:hypothetical protein
MLATLLFAFGLMALCVVIHAVGLGAAFLWLDRSRAPVRTFWRWTRLLVALAGWTILVHLVEITLWALFYTWKKAMPDLPSALYFSSVTYTTTGYGDLVLPKDWRLVGGVEALTGILMCGWSTGFFFAIVSRIQEAMALARTNIRTG